MAVAATACSLPSPRENLDATAQLVRAQSRAILEWRRNPAEDEAARTRAAALLDDGVSMEDAVAVAFLASPGLQVQLAQLEISRAELLAAMTPPNPVVIVGSRKPGGDLAAFYPERSVSVGVLQNVMALLTMTDRIAIAQRDLERARFDTAQQVVSFMAQVVQAWLEYSAAVQIHQLDVRNTTTRRSEVDALTARVAGDATLTDRLTQGRVALVKQVDQTIRSELVVATARARLGEYMGTSGWRDDWQVTGRLPPVPAADPDLTTIEAAAMERRLDLAAAARAVDVRLRALAMQRRFRWINQLEVGVFREKALGGTPFTGPNAVIEAPLLDHRVAQLLQSDAELAIAMRRLQAARIAARTEIAIKVAEFRAIRQQLQQIGDGPLAPEEEPIYVGMQREYWRARSAVALAAGDWGAISGL